MRRSFTAERARDRHPSRRVDALDALLWLTVTAVTLMLVPIGFISGDGLAHSARFADGSWTLNPNHLLFEPIGAAWQRGLSALDFPRPAPDQLKLLSVLFGSIALAVVRWGVAGRLAPSRLAANHGTAWVALSAAFAALWVSDEIHMLQMPFIALAAVAMLRYVHQPDWHHAAAAGAWTGVAALVYISNALLAATLALVVGGWELRRRGWREALTAAAAIGGAAILVALPIMLAAWAAAAPRGTGFLEWLTAYGGDAAARTAGLYGIGDSLREVAVATARAGYGTANALVDLAPAVAALRVEESLSPRAVAPIAVFCLAVAAGAFALIRAVRGGGWRSHYLLMITAAWALAYVGFGIFWNNSDDQFYFQLAIPVGALMSTLPIHGTRATQLALVASTVALTWNTVDVLAERILYPREERVAALEHALAGAGLVILPGEEEIDHLLYFVDQPGDDRRLSLTSLAARWPADSGLSVLESGIRTTLGRGDRVDVVGIFDTPAVGNPWPALEQLGYGSQVVQGILARFPVEAEPRRAGPFTVRSLFPEGDSTPVTAAQRVDSGTPQPDPDDRILVDFRRSLQRVATLEAALALFGNDRAGAWHFTTDLDGEGTNALRLDHPGWNGRECGDGGGLMVVSLPRPKPREIYMQWKMHMGRTRTGGGIGPVGEFTIANAACGNAGRKVWGILRDVPDQGSRGRIDLLWNGPSPVWASFAATYGFEGNLRPNRGAPYRPESLVGRNVTHTIYLRAESAPGAGDGVIRLWVDGDLRLEHRGVPLNADGFHRFQFPMTFRAPAHDQSEYFWDILAWEPRSEPVDLDP